MVAQSIIAYAINNGDMSSPPEPPRFYVPGTYRPEQSVGYLMRQVLSSVLAQADGRLAAHDLTYAQWLPLYKLVMNEALTSADLARHLDIDPAAMTRALDRLEAKGLLRRVRSERDRRVVNLHLTEEGRAVAVQVPPVLADVLNQHLQGFSEAEWRQLVDLLQRMLANGEALRASRGPAPSEPAAPAAPPAPARQPNPTRKKTP